VCVYIYIYMAVISYLNMSFLWWQAAWFWYSDWLAGWLIGCLAIWP